MAYNHNNKNNATGWFKYFRITLKFQKIEKLNGCKCC